MEPRTCADCFEELDLCECDHFLLENLDEDDFVDDNTDGFDDDDVIYF